VDPGWKCCGHVPVKKSQIITINSSIHYKDTMTKIIMAGPMHVCRCIGMNWPVLLMYLIFAADKCVLITIANSLIRYFDVIQFLTGR
jgi:hypothetical protein